MSGSERASGGGSRWPLDSSKRMIINALGAFKTTETLAAAHFQSQGFDSMQCESRPFHVLFGIYMWLA